MSIFLQAIVETIKDTLRGFIWFGKNSRYVGRLVGKIMFVTVPYFLIEFKSNFNLSWLILGLIWISFSLTVLLKMGLIEEEKKA